MAYTPKSALFKRLLGQTGCTTAQLQEAFALESQHLTREEMVTLKAWLDTGEPEPQTEAQLRVLTLMLARAAAKLMKQSRAKQPLIESKQKLRS